MIGFRRPFRAGRVGGLAPGTLSPAKFRLALRAAWVIRVAADVRRR